MIRLGIVRSCIASLAGLYLLGGFAAILGFVQVRSGPAELAAWFTSTGASPSRFLVVGMLYCATGVMGIAAAWVFGTNDARGRLFASVFVAFVSLDILGDFYRKRTTGFEVEDIVAMAVSGILLLIASVYLIQSRRRLETKPT